MRKLPSPSQYNAARKNSSPRIKNLLNSEQIASVIGKVKHIYKITSAQDEYGNISRLTGHVLVGLLPIKDFIHELQNRVKLDQETTRKVAYDIRNELFALVAKELAEMQTRIPEIQKAAEITIKKDEAESRLRQQLLSRMKEEKPEAPVPTLPDESVIRQLPEKPPIARRLPHIEKSKSQPSASEDAATTAPPPTPKPLQPPAHVESPIPKKPVAPVKPPETPAPLQQAPSSSAGKQDKPLTPPAPKKPTGPPIPPPQEPKQMPPQSPAPPPQQAPAPESYGHPTPEPSARRGAGGAGQARQGPAPPKNLPM